MTDKNRRHRRIEKNIHLEFCAADALPKKWDICVLKNISGGGVMFVALSNLSLQDKILQLKIRIPQLAPVVLELEGRVVNVKPCLNDKQSEVRVEFINVSEANKKHLSVLETMK